MYFYAELSFIYLERDIPKSPVFTTWILEANISGVKVNRLISVAWITDDDLPEFDTDA